jgi:scyllo-inositol 2-dehydrogenase (NADP+)
MNLQPVRTAILSYGMSGEVFHAPLLQALPEFEISTIVQRNAEKAAKHFPSVKIVRTVDEALRDPLVELVVVNTPNETHFDFASKALKNGKHVVVEKPFTVTSHDADLLIREAKKTNRMITVFQNRRWDSDFLTVKKIVQENVLGKIVEYETHYDRFRNYIEPNTWKEESGPGTGILYNLGSHMLDQVLVLFGLPDYVDARLGVQRPGGKVDDFYDIRLEYPEHLVIVKSSYLVKEPLPRYIIHGINGSFVKCGLDPQEQALKEKISPLSESWGTETIEQWGKINVLKNNESVEQKIPSAKGDYLAFYRNVYAAIRIGAPLAVKPEESRDVIRVIEACYESNKNKCAVGFSAGKG